VNEIKVFPIGKIEVSQDEMKIVLDGQYRAGLRGLEDFGHVQVLWWMDGCDNPSDRAALVQQKPYTKGPEILGAFAVRAPERPNPIAVSNAPIAYVDEEHGIVGLYYIDAFNGSAVLDLKPYTPSIDRIENPRVPDWCSHWPGSFEDSADFDWGAEFHF